MTKRILRYVKHIVATILVLGTIAVIVLLNIGASLHYGDHPLMMTIDNEGPYVFFENDSILNVNYIRGNKTDGFYVDKKEYPIDSKPLSTKSPTKTKCPFPNVQFKFSSMTLLCIRKSLNVL